MRERAQAGGDGEADTPLGREATLKSLQPFVWEAALITHCVLFHQSLSEDLSAVLLALQPSKAGPRSCVAWSYNAAKTFSREHRVWSRARLESLHHHSPVKGPETGLSLGFKICSMKITIVPISWVIIHFCED